MDQTETPAPGEAPIMRPLGAGDPAPTFMLPDPDDVMISSAELLENGPLVVTFYRGIWCPYCRQDLKDLGNAAGHPFVRCIARCHRASDRSRRQRQVSAGTWAGISDPRRPSRRCRGGVPDPLVAAGAGGRGRAAREAPGFGH